MTMQSLEFLSNHWDEVKFWLSLLAMGGFIWRFLDSVKQIKTQDLPNLQKGLNQVEIGLNNQTTKLGDKLTEISMQNQLLTSEFKGLRDDFRVYSIAPILSAAKAKQTKKKKA